MAGRTLRGMLSTADYKDNKALKSCHMEFYIFYSAVTYKKDITSVLFLVNNFAMKKYLSLCFLILFAMACNNDSKLAENLLREAQAYCEAHEWATTKLYIDSLRKTYPKEVKIQRGALLLMRKINLAEQTRNLNYCDSMLIVCQIKADLLKKNFVFEKDTIYDEVGKYISKQQQLESNMQKSYIRCSVNERGEMYLASVYYEVNPINHSRLKVSKPDGQYSETENIPRDGGLNYSFKNLGATTEIVTYMKGKDGGVIQFICNNRNEKLTAEYLGGSKVYTFTMAGNDKNAVVEMNELAIVLSDIEQLKKEIPKAQRRIEYLKEKTTNVSDNSDFCTEN